MFEVPVNLRICMQSSSAFVIIAAMAPLKEATLLQLNSVCPSLSLSLCLRERNARNVLRIAHFEANFQFEFAAKAAFSVAKMTTVLWPTWSGAEKRPRRRPWRLRGCFGRRASSASSRSVALSGMPRMAQRIQKTQTHTTRTGCLEGREGRPENREESQDSHCLLHIFHFNLTI